MKVCTCPVKIQSLCSLPKILRKEEETGGNEISGLLRLLNQFRADL